MTFRNTTPIRDQARLLHSKRPIPQQIPSPAGTPCKNFPIISSQNKLYKTAFGQINTRKAICLYVYP